MKLIAFTGRNKVGKTQIANGVLVFLEGLGYKVRKLSFADVLRDELESLYHIDKRTFTYKPTDEYIPPIIQKAIDAKCFDPVHYKDQLIVRLGDLELSNETKLLWKSVPKYIEFGYNKIQFNDIKVTLRELMIFHSTHIRREIDTNWWTDLFSYELAESRVAEVDIVINDDARFYNEFEVLRCHADRVIWLDNGNDSEPDEIEKILLKWKEEIGIPEKVITDMIDKVPIPIGPKQIYSIFETFALPLIGEDTEGGLNT